MKFIEYSAPLVLAAGYRLTSPHSSSSSSCSINIISIPALLLHAGLVSAAPRPPSKDWFLKLETRPVPAVYARDEDGATDDGDTHDSYANYDGDEFDSDYLSKRDPQAFNKVIPYIIQAVRNNDSPMSDPSSQDTRPPPSYGPSTLRTDQPDSNQYTHSTGGKNNGMPTSQRRDAQFGSGHSKSSGGMSGGGGSSGPQPGDFGKHQGSGMSGGGGSWKREAQLTKAKQSTGSGSMGGGSAGPSHSDSFGTQNHHSMGSGGGSGGSGSMGISWKREAQNGATQDLMRMMQQLQQMMAQQNAAAVAAGRYNAAKRPIAFEKRDEEKRNPQMVHASQDIMHTMQQLQQQLQQQNAALAAAARHHQKPANEVIKREAQGYVTNPYTNYLIEVIQGLRQQMGWQQNSAPEPKFYGNEGLPQKREAEPEPAPIDGQQKHHNRPMTQAGDAPTGAGAGGQQQQQKPPSTGQLFPGGVYKREAEPEPNKVADFLKSSYKPVGGKVISKVGHPRRDTAPEPAPQSDAPAPQTSQVQDGSGTVNPLPGPQASQVQDGAPPRQRERRESDFMPTNGAGSSPQRKGALAHPFQQTTTDSRAHSPQRMGASPNGFPQSGMDKRQYEPEAEMEPESHYPSFDESDFVSGPPRPQRGPYTPPNRNKSGPQRASA